MTDGSSVGERVAASLRSLLRDPDRAPVLILGTMWRSFNQQLVDEPNASGDPHAQARALLANCRIEVPECFAGITLTAFRDAARSDPRLELALEHARDGKLTQFLAGAPQLEHRYRLATASVKALIYIEEALEVYKRADDEGDMMALSAAVRLFETCDRTEEAIRWLDILAEDGDRDALREAGRLLERTAGYETALVRYRAAADAGDAAGLVMMARLLEATNRRREAATMLGEKTGDHEIPPPLVFREAARIMFERGTENQASGIYNLAADSWEHAMLYAVAAALEETGDRERALSAYQRAAVGGNQSAIRRASGLLIEDGRAQEALDWLMVLLDAGDYCALEIAADVLDELGRVSEADRLRRYGRDIDGSIANAWSA